jgi:hypothetical protein
MEDVKCSVCFNLNSYAGETSSSFEVYLNLVVLSLQTVCNIIVSRLLGMKTESGIS